jgi:hypothetical protein
MTNQYYECGAQNVSIRDKRVLRAVYKCMSCVDFTRYFLIEFSPDLSWMQKVGQLPPWDISVNKEMRDLLDERLDIYQRGLICESQGYGIGAFAYYRRIVEDFIDELLNDMYELIDEKDKDDYKVAWDQVKGSHNATDKIKAVQDLLPSSLTPGGTNPLKLLYKTLSEGIHSDSDDVCLEEAETIRHILTFLINEVKKHQHDSKEFTTNIKKLIKKPKSEVK